MTPQQRNQLISKQRKLYNDIMSEQGQIRQANEQSNAYAPRIMVNFKDGVTSKQKRNFAERYGLSLVRESPSQVEGIPSRTIFKVQRFSNELLRLNPSLNPIIDMVEVDNTRIQGTPKAAQRFGASGISGIESALATVLGSNRPPGSPAPTQEEKNQAFSYLLSGATGGAMADDYAVRRNSSFTPNPQPIAEMPAPSPVVQPSPVKNIRPLPKTRIGASSVATPANYDAMMAQQTYANLMRDQMAAYQAQMASASNSQFLPGVPPPAVPANSQDNSQAATNFANLVPQAGTQQNPQLPQVQPVSPVSSLARQRRPQQSFTQPVSPRNRQPSVRSFGYGNPSIAFGNQAIPAF